MKIKTYLVPTFSQAVSMIKKDLGPEALILSTKPQNMDRAWWKTSENLIEVTAALDMEENSFIDHKKDLLQDRNQSQTDMSQWENDVTELCHSLFKKGFGVSLIEQLAHFLCEENVSQGNCAEQAALWLLEQMPPIFSWDNFLNNIPNILLISGTNEAGRTMVALQLAEKLLQQRLKVGFISLSPTASIFDRLTRETLRKSHIRFSKTQSITTLMSAVQRMKDCECIIIDDDFSHQMTSQMTSLFKNKNLWNGLVLPLDSSQENIHQVKRSQSQSPDGLILTHNGIFSKMGSLIQAPLEFRVPLSFLVDISKDALLEVPHLEKILDMIFNFSHENEILKKELVRDLTVSLQHYH